MSAANRIHTICPLNWAKRFLTQSFFFLCRPNLHAVVQLGGRIALRKNAKHTPGTRPVIIIASGTHRVASADSRDFRRVDADAGKRPGAQEDGRRCIHHLTADTAAAQRAAPHAPEAPVRATRDRAPTKGGRSIHQSRCRPCPSSLHHHVQANRSMVRCSGFCIVVLPPFEHSRMLKPPSFPIAVPVFAERPACPQVQLAMAGHVIKESECPCRPGTATARYHLVDSGNRQQQKMSPISIQPGIAFLQERSLFVCCPATDGH
jgi:hypothetical protein